MLGLNCRTAFSYTPDECLREENHVIPLPCLPGEIQRWFCASLLLQDIRLYRTSDNQPTDDSVGTGKVSYYNSNLARGLD